MRQKRGGGLPSRSRPGRRSVNGVATRTRSFVGLEIEAGKDPIRGRLRHVDGTAVPFWGWLDLIEELRRVASEQPERAPPVRRPARPRRIATPVAHVGRRAPIATTLEES